MKSKIKFGDFLYWRNIAAGFTCYKCGKRYEGKQRGLAYNEKIACVPCASKCGFVGAAAKFQGVEKSL